MSPVNPFDQHRQRRGTQMNAAGSGLRPDETAAFQALAEQAQAMAISP